MFFVGGGSGFPEVAYKEKLGERAGVVFSSFGGKSEEDEEDKCANDAGPLSQGVPGHYEVVASPEDCWNLSNTTEIIMSIFPADPRHDGSGGDRKSVV